MSLNDVINNQKEKKNNKAEATAETVTLTTEAGKKITYEIKDFEMNNYFEKDLPWVLLTMKLKHENNEKLTVNSTILLDHIDRVFCKVEYLDFVDESLETTEGVEGFKNKKTLLNAMNKYLDTKGHKLIIKSVEERFNETKMDERNPFFKIYENLGLYDNIDEDADKKYDERDTNSTKYFKDLFSDFRVDKALKMSLNDKEDVYEIYEISEYCKENNYWIRRGGVSARSFSGAFRLFNEQLREEEISDLGM
ncbi:MAG: hypothetical protein C0602_08565 [Denitrovibrio sp.]|nr:MAG: hypothetical protein C0602_08565 [Denitrovibrio sp.]